jgi:glucose uptake protein GlcU
MFYIWLEPEFHRVSNGTSPTSKLLLSRQESSTQVGIQNLSGCCVTVCWAVGPCTMLKPVRVASVATCTPLTSFYSVAVTTLGFRFCLESICHRTVSPFIGLWDSTS